MNTISRIDSTVPSVDDLDDLFLGMCLLSPEQKTAHELLIQIIYSTQVQLDMESFLTK